MLYTMYMYMYMYMYMHVQVHRDYNVSSHTLVGRWAGSQGTKKTGRSRSFPGMGTDIDMKGSKVTDSYINHFKAK